MQRNNIFIWAYITAILLCAVARPFVDFSIWNSLVLAITVSSTILSLEDLFATFHKSYDEYCNDTEKFIHEDMQNVQDKLSFFKKQSARIREQPFHRDCFSCIQKEIDETIKELETIISLSEELECSIMKSRPLLSKCKKASVIMNYLSFLCLFCIVFFFSKIPISHVFLESLTILAFALILATQQFKQYYLSENKKNAENTQEMLRLNEKWKESRKKLESELERMFDIASVINKVEAEINRIEQDKKQKEAIANAN